MSKHNEVPLPRALGRSELSQVSGGQQQQQQPSPQQQQQQGAGPWETGLRYAGAALFGGIGSLGGPVVGAAAGALGYDYFAAGGRAIDQGRHQVGPNYGTFPIGGPGGGRKDARVCFVAGTHVSTPNGRAPIETIASGDLVCAWDGHRDVLTATLVVCLETHEDEAVDIFELGFAGGSSVRVTKGHPFWTGSEWIKSEDLRSGVSLLARAGIRTITSVDRAAGLHTVYNVRTEAGTYLVGAVGAVVSGWRAEDRIIRASDVSHLAERGVAAEFRA